MAVKSNTDYVTSFMLHHLVIVLTNRLHVALIQNVTPACMSVNYSIGISLDINNVVSIVKNQKISFYLITTLPQGR